MLTQPAAMSALILALVATMSLAQSGEADPPTAGTVPESEEERVSVGPQQVLTLEQKRELQAFCNKAANRKHASCQGVATPQPTDPED